jgi:hypothetical protein
MKTKFALLLVLAVLLLFSSLADAKPTVKCTVVKISEHQLLVTFQWRVSIFSDKAWDGCDLRISFRDDKDRELYLVHEVLKLKTGQNEFSGTDICNKDVWKRAVKYLTTLDCQF